MTLTLQFGVDDEVSCPINGAYLKYDEHTRGSLEVGKVANLAVLDLEDIRMLEDDPELLFGMRERIELTMSGGAVRYRTGT